MNDRRKITANMNHHQDLRTEPGKLIFSNRIGALVILGLVVTYFSVEAAAAEPAARPALPALPAVESVPQWEQHRPELLRVWGTVLGRIPTNRPVVRAERVSAEDLGDYKRTLLRYEIEPGLPTEGYLLEQKETHGPLPAVVVFHPTTPLGARGVAGLEPAYPSEKHHGVQLVKRGYVVLCPRNFINETGGDYMKNVADVLSRHPGWKGMTRMLYDAIRAADVLESMPAVDKSRIGCLGHSLGAKQVLYAMAFDTRYKAGVFSEGGIGLKFSNWEAPWYLGDRIKQPGFSREHNELMALAAPRAFLLLAGDSADDDRGLAFLESVRPVYRLYGAETNLVWLNHREGHTYGTAARTAAEEFLDGHLKPQR